MTGLGLENGGGDGTALAHWERAIMKNELMAGNDLTGDIVLSGATVNVFVDSGWYEVNEVLTDATFWGKG